MKRNSYLNLLTILIVVLLIANLSFPQPEEKKDEKFLKTSELLLQDEQYDELIRVSREYWEENPTYAPAYRLFVLGNVYGNKDLDRVENYLKDKLKENKTEAEAFIHYALGYLYFLRDKLDESEQELRESLVLNPAIALAQNNLGAILSIQWKLDEALTFINKALEIEPDLQVAKYNLESILLKKNCTRTADSMDKLVRLIEFALEKKDLNWLEQIKTSNLSLVEENSFEAIQRYSNYLRKSIDFEIKDIKQTAKINLEIACVLTDFFEKSTLRSYFSKKYKLFLNWNEKDKRKYLEGYEFHKKGEYLRKQYQYIQAIENYEKSKNIFRLISYQEGEAETLRSLGEVNRALSNYKEASQYYAQALVIFREIGAIQSVAETLLCLGNVYYMLDDYKTAHKSYDQSLSIFYEFRYKKGEAESLRSLGDVHYILDDYETARKNYEQALAIFRGFRLRIGEAETLRSLGNLYRALSGYEKARQFYDEALRIFCEKEFLLGEGYTRKNLGDIYYRIDNYEKAREFYDKALEIFHKTKSSPGKAYTIQSLGDVHYMLSEYDNARKDYDEALGIFRQVRDRLGEANLLQKIGNIYWALKEYKKSLQSFKQALGIQEKINDCAGKLWSYYRIGKIFEYLKIYTKALKNYKKSIAIIEDVWQKMKIEEHKAAYFDSKLLPYKSVISLLFRQGKGEQAYSFAERAKARSFLYLLGNKKIDPRTGAPMNLVRQEEEMRQAIVTKNREIEINAQKETGLQLPPGKLKNELMELKTKHNEVFQQIKLRSPEYASMINVFPLDTAEIQTLIRDGIGSSNAAVLVEYFLSDEAIFIWLLDGKKIYPYRVEIKAEDLNKKIEDFQSMLANSSFALENLSGLGHDLYNLLLQPMEMHWNAQSNPTLAVVPHGSLHCLPFEALMKNGKFLTELGVKIFYLPSAGVYKFCREKNSMEKKQLMAFGNPDGTLAFSGDEANELKQLYPKDTEVFTGEQVKESAVKHYAQYPDILHLSCHGSFVAAQPLYSALSLGSDHNDDGRLEVFEIFQLSLKPAYLVTLSACQTSLGGISRGDEITGLTRAFIYAGTSAILASLWSVDDYYTNKFMITFYRSLSKGNKIDALHEARMEMINKYGKRHPFYWAAFVLTGDPR